MAVPIRGKKTYWYLQNLKRMPSEYEIVTNNMLSYPTVGDKGGDGSIGFELGPENPVTKWYKQYQAGSLLQCSDWEAFKDPHQLSYRKFNQTQDQKEVFVDTILRRVNETNYDDNLSEEWLQVLRRAWAPLRYPVHGMQMISSYAGSMAPGGKIFVCLMFQAANDMRVVQRVAQRVWQLKEHRGNFGADDQRTWEEDELWQPLRECIEKLLIAYDWGESFVGLNLAVRPILDIFFNEEFTMLARQNDDLVIADIHSSFNDDSRWHREWSRALVQVAVKDRAENANVIRTWIEKWAPRAQAGVKAFRPVFEEMAPNPMDFDRVLHSLDRKYQLFLEELEITSGT